MYISLSNRQHPMLEMFATARSSWFLSLANARSYDQRPFRSMLVQGWIAFHKDLGEEGGFQVTEEGRQAYSDYTTTSIFRSEGQFSRPLTSYFDAKAYGLRVVHRKKHVA